MPIVLRHYIFKDVGCTVGRKLCITEPIPQGSVGKKKLMLLSV